MSSIPCPNTQFLGPVFPSLIFSAHQSLTSSFLICCPCLFSFSSLSPSDLPLLVPKSYIHVLKPSPLISWGQEGKRCPGQNLGQPPCHLAGRLSWERGQESWRCKELGEGFPGGSVEKKCESQYSSNLYSWSYPLYIRRDQSRDIDALQNSMALPVRTYQWVASPSHSHLCNIHLSSR